MMIFTLFLPKASPKVIETIKTMFAVILGWLANIGVTAHLGVTMAEEGEDERTD